MSDMPRENDEIAPHGEPPCNADCNESPGHGAAEGAGGGHLPGADEPSPAPPLRVESETPGLDGRDARGRFVAGGRAAAEAGRATRFRAKNTASVVHGGRSERLRHRLLDEPQGVARLEGKRSAILADLGGESEISTVKRDLLDRYLQTDALAGHLGGHLIAEGVLTAKGRSRAALSAFLQVLDRQHRLAVAIGLERRQKALPSLEQYLRSASKGSS